jgi:diphthamide biosynthesis methyltransferase
MNYEIIKKNYERGLWSAIQVEIAVKKGVITREECDKILGKVTTETPAN